MNSISDIEYFIAGKFNYFDDIYPAKTDPYVESCMVQRLKLDPANRFSDDELAKAVHNMVHVSKHYFVKQEPPKHGPWDFQQALTHPQRR